MCQAFGNEKTKAALNRGIAGVGEVPSFDLRIFLVEMFVRSRDVRHGEPQLKALVERVVQLQRSQSIDRADLVVIGRDRANPRTATSQPRLILIDVLKGKIERKASRVAELQGVKIDRTR